MENKENFLNSRKISEEQKNDTIELNTSNIINHTQHSSIKLKTTKSKGNQNNRKRSANSNKDSKIRKIPIKDLIFESEVKLYKDHNKIPYFLYTHLILVITLTFFMFNIQKDMKLIDSHEKTFLNFFDLNIGEKHHYTDIQVLKDEMRQTLDSIFTLEDKFLNSFKILNENNLKIKFDSKFIPTATTSIPIIKGETYPFDEASNKDIRNKLKAISKFYINLQYEVEIPDAIVSCYSFNTKFIYDFTIRGYIEHYIEMQRSICDSYDSSLATVYNLLIFSLILIVLGLIEIIIAFKKVYYSFKVLYQLKTNCSLTGNMDKWTRLSFTDKLRFFNLWNFFFILNSLIIIFSKSYL